MKTEARGRNKVVGKGVGRGGEVGIRWRNIGRLDA